MKLGVIGVGNMGGAIIRGCITGGFDPADITVCGHHPDQLKEMADKLGISVSASAESLTAASDIILIAVKPANVAEVLYDIEPAFTEKKILVSIAAGRTIESLAASCGTARRIVRAMPNTPALVGSGMTALSRSEYVTDDDYRAVESIFSCIGLVQEVPEPDGCGHRSVRQRTGLRLYVHRGTCRRRSFKWPPEKAGCRVGSSDGARFSANGARDGRTPGRAQRRGMLSGRYDYRGGKRA